MDTQKDVITTKYFGYFVTTATQVALSDDDFEGSFIIKFFEVTPEAGELFVHVFQ